jgi:hypothetical protein
VEGDEFGVPAGWYPDPLGLPQLRWWDSQAWTEFTSEARAPMIVQPAAAAAAGATVTAGTTTTAEASTTTTAAGGGDDSFATAARTATVEEPLISRREQRERERLERLAEDDFLVDSRSDSEEYVFGEQRTAAETAGRFTASDLFAESFAEPTATDPAPSVQAAPLHEEVGAQPLLATTLRELEAPVAETLDTSSASPRSASMHANAMPGASALDSIELEATAPERALNTKRTYTGAAWIIALLWVIQLGAAAAAIFLFDEGHNQALIWLIWIGAYLVSVGIASYDRLVLQTWGHTKPASAWWALFSPPVYLTMRLLRTFKETGKGFALLGGAFASGVVVVVANLLVPAFLLSSLPGYFAEEAATAAENTASLLGVTMTVECPPETLPLVPNTAFQCYATTEGGNQDTVRLSLQRQNLWVGWRVDSIGSWLLTD